MGFFCHYRGLWTTAIAFTCPFTMHVPDSLDTFYVNRMA